MKEKLKKYGLTEAELQRILVNQKKPKIRSIDKLYKNHEEVKIAVVSDTHLGSKYEDLEALHHFYKHAKAEGCQCVLHSGDIVQGSHRIYRGGEYELHTFGAESQAKYVRDNYPRDLTTYFITGNHCASFWKDAGIDIGTLIDCPEIRYIGSLQADITIKGIKFRLIHPSGSPAYALSYKIQKFAEQMRSGEKPNVFISGHYHSSVYFFYRNMHCLMAGSFQKQTPYLLAKGVNPTIGGWILTLRGKEGENIGIDTSFILFPK